MSTASSAIVSQVPSKKLKSTSPLPLSGESVRTAPLTADIGGTMTKVVFWVPENTEIELPQFVQTEEGTMIELSITPDPSLNVTSLIL